MAQTKSIYDIPYEKYDRLIVITSRFLEGTKDEHKWVNQYAKLLKSYISKLVNIRDYCTDQGKRYRSNVKFAKGTARYAVRETKHAIGFTTKTAIGIGAAATGAILGAPVVAAGGMVYAITVITNSAVRKHDHRKAAKEEKKEKEKMK